MAGSITVTTSEEGSGVIKYSVAWLSDASGNVSANTFSMGSGTIVMVEFVPDSGGTQPTDLYDVTLTDAEGVNVLDDGTGSASIGANLSNTAASHRVPFIGGGGTVTYVRTWVHSGLFTPVVAAAGNAKGGTINVYQVPGVI